MTYMKYMKYMPWVLAVIAIWLIAAPFVLGYAESAPAMRNDVGVGIVVLVGALSWGLSTMRRAAIHIQQR